MSEDPTRNLPASENSTLEQILVTVRSSENRLGNLESRLESLESKVEERLYDTRPIWEKVQADIARLQEGQQRLEEGQQRFDERLEALRDETRTGFRNLKRQFGVLYETFIEVRADYKDLDKRIYRFEEPLEEPHP
jgi:chromosome segregation ATPase